MHEPPPPDSTRQHTTEVKWYVPTRRVYPPHAGGGGHVDNPPSGLDATHHNDGDKVVNFLPASNTQSYQCVGGGG